MRWSRPLGLLLSFIIFAALAAVVYAQLNDVHTASGVINAVPFASSAVPGDCNGDEDINSADIIAVVLEIFDGDGTAPDDAPDGSFAGTVGCDSNQDETISAPDITCVVLIIFEGADRCSVTS